MHTKNKSERHYACILKSRQVDMNVILMGRNDVRDGKGRMLG